MDRASQVLAQGLPLNTPRTWAALSEKGDVPLHTLYYRARGRLSIEEKAQRQQYLTPEEERGLVTFLLLMSNLRQPIQIKYIPSLALTLARQRYATTDNPKPPGKNWARAFEKRHPELKARRVKEKRHKRNIYNKVI
ncbi:hypothetical protein K491DRAFT_699731 [Lophiostoma macrostomum CBS 122681]|uniref:HTH CENPB-type domain-containing protein n=1 Tax=Lophiostoma macrostomum CBS 122681 TaxID=1314788 RepID=A0A6A6SHD3_9PLEO|nr:hypothetical protein K491DRAFT_699731 [Lophiostoma macrostomum CBS 122681]